MKVLRAFAIVALLGIAAYVGYRAFVPSAPSGATKMLTAYFVKPETEALAKYSVSLNPKTTDIDGVAFYATAQVIAGPPAEISAIRFPTGTVARSVHVSAETATVDLGGNIAASPDGSFAESGQFKALVWTLTGISGISAVQVTIDGAKVPTLPGGHFEIDEPLSRKSF
jgi:spore germination protein GerM